MRGIADAAFFFWPPKANCMKNRHDLRKKSQQYRQKISTSTASTPRHFVAERAFSEQTQRTATQAVVASNKADSSAS